VLHVVESHAEASQAADAAGKPRCAFGRERPVGVRARPRVAVDGGSVTDEQQVHAPESLAAFARRCAVLIAVPRDAQ
jgi:hypothetical protein